MKIKLLSLIILLSAVLSSCVYTLPGNTETAPAKTEDIRAEFTDKETDKGTDITDVYTLPDPDAIAPFTNKAYVPINGNMPYFTEDEITDEPYEYYSPLDSLGRCGYTVACLGRELMPTSERENISSVRPTGWMTTKYDFIDGENLYNRCHLIGFQLAGENANEKNLITGTRYMNTEGMLPFENMIADYIKETDNCVMYRVSPVFVGDELVARGVLMEGYSVEDEGEGICFNVYAYNCQPGVEIDYKTGKNKLVEIEGGVEASYILNINSKKFHKPDCASVKDISQSNKKTFEGTKEELVLRGYSPCGSCKP